MKHLDTHWLIYGESEFALWLLLPVLVLALWFSLRWLSAERGKPGFARRLLPFTWTALIVMTVWLMWRPTLVRVDNWEYDAETIVMVDQSASMEVKTAGTNVSQQLDNLAFWNPGAVRERRRAPRDLNAALTAARQDGDTVRDQLQSARDELEQGLPKGPVQDAAINGFANWAATMKADIALNLDKLGSELESLGVAGSDLQTTIEPLTNQLVGSLNAVPEKVSNANIVGFSDTMTAIDNFAAASTALQDALPSVQQQLDEAFMRAQGDALKSAMKAVADQTRLDAAKHIQETGLSLAATSVEMAETQVTELYGNLEQVLATQKDKVIANILLLSDGGHNGTVHSDVTDRLKKADIKLTTVGIGRPSRNIDIGILDWETPTTMRSGRNSTMTVRLKTRAPANTEFDIVLSPNEGEALVRKKVICNGAPELTTTIAFRAPKKTGQHSLRLSVDIEDESAENNVASFFVQTIKGKPRSLLVGQLPNWDSAYLYLSMKQAGLNPRQYFTDFDEGEPRRGGSPKSIPKSLNHWAKNRTVVLHGSPFKGFTDKDAETLFEYVSTKGGSLIIVPNKGQSYIDALAAKFAWSASTQSLAPSAVHVAASSQHLPVLRLATDGAQSARRLAELGEMSAATTVPQQNLVLLTDQQEQPVVSMGFYGRGRVILWGIQNMHELSEYAKSMTLGRYLRQSVADAGMSLFPDKANTVTTYPSQPVVNRENLVITVADTTTVQLTGENTLALTRGNGNAMGTIKPEKAGPVTLSADGQAITVDAIDNPGMELVYYEFNDAFLKSMVADDRGQYVPMTKAIDTLSQLKPGTWQGSTANRYPLADHVVLLLLMAIVGTAHWALRKIAGLAI